MIPHTQLIASGGKLDKINLIDQPISWLPLVFYDPHFDEIKTDLRSFSLSYFQSKVLQMDGD